MVFWLLASYLLPSVSIWLLRNFGISEMLGMFSCRTWTKGSTAIKDKTTHNRRRKTIHNRRRMLYRSHFNSMNVADTHSLFMTDTIDLKAKKRWSTWRRQPVKNPFIRRGCESTACSVRDYRQNFLWKISYIASPQAWVCLPWVIVVSEVDVFLFDYLFFLEVMNLSTLGMTLGSVR